MEELEWRGSGSEEAGSSTVCLIHNDTQQAPGGKYWSKWKVQQQILELLTRAIVATGVGRQRRSSSGPHTPRRQRDGFPYSKATQYTRREGYAPAGILQFPPLGHKYCGNPSNTCPHTNYRDILCLQSQFVVVGLSVFSLRVSLSSFAPVCSRVMKEACPPRCRQKKQALRNIEAKGVIVEKVSSELGTEEESIIFQQLGFFPQNVHSIAARAESGAPAQRY